MCVRARACVFFAIMFLQQKQHVVCEQCVCACVCVSTEAGICGAERKARGGRERWRE